MSADQGGARNPGLAIGTLFVTVATLCISWNSAGSGHGNFVWARILLPYACAAMGMRALQFLVIPFAILQVPVYGFLIVLAKRSGQLAAVVASILISHVVVAVLTFTLLQESFR